MTRSEFQQNIFRSAEHLGKAGYYMLSCNQEAANNLFDYALKLIKIIEPESVISKDRLEAVINEIINFKDKAGNENDSFSISHQQ
ncbi:MAG: hypothetical protein A2504_06995 [Bdellovibrionales bacterium RIFOXYD12_FULL_39_22]|nr:MAG: hypothetical protein A2385_05210 [Bdellovibrionales bacterium RIFOXYB1_FULL_39_21]OFZ44321.1 MAG: hypothetical protein A2485_15990 [Bdellovibrionales bacterium RIFOXYC12_FULL_39_17]OFZ49176.1 MAG: hypothetical protein A2404_15930 [Bdellovibrionales bacterium RIFOXYC1_FULL_39_130]OFZ76984.1 MAG: hypothetical protein A2560_11015 [Bdellovibrionales bacterium RIFOXYD1_FULL_39_84]OFZ95197.1 MAG: hypothetical protein A2504_06995 [Bdellovibrionales bacterium RIFOXYD12_FULL_39_22]HLE09650.1 hy